MVDRAPLPQALEAVFAEDLAWGPYVARGLAAATLAACAALPGRPQACYELNKALRWPLKNAAPRVFDVERFGLALRLVTRGNYCETTALFAPRRYDVPERAWVAERLPPEGVFLDIGGNVGLYSLSAAAARPGARVVAVEPDPRLATRMRFNARGNGLQVEHHELALGTSAGRARLLRSDRQSGANRLLQDRDVVGDIIDVELLPLMDLCARAGIDRIDVMKIDIEGHEKPVLGHFFAHAPAGLHPHGIVIEHTHDGQGLVDALLGEQGYRIEARTARNLMLAKP